jgi:hypothetical protein
VGLGAAGAGNDGADVRKPAERVFGQECRSVRLVERHRRRVRRTRLHEGLGVAGVDQQVDVRRRQVAEDLLIELLLRQGAVRQHQRRPTIVVPDPVAAEEDEGRDSRGAWLDRRRSAGAAPRSPGEGYRWWDPAPRPPVGLPGARFLVDGSQQDPAARQAIGQGKEPQCIVVSEAERR